MVGNYGWLCLVCVEVTGATFSSPQVANERLEMHAWLDHRGMSASGIIWQSVKEV